MDKLDLVNQLGIKIFRLLVLSNEFHLEEMFQYIQNHFIEKETSWIQQNLFLL